MKFAPLLRSAAVVAVVSLAACSPDAHTTGPDVQAFAQVAPDDISLTVCKVSWASFEGLPDDGSVGLPFVFDASAPAGTALTGVVSHAATRPYADDGTLDCQVVWTGPVGTEVTVTEVAGPIGYDFELMSLSGIADSGAYLTFTNHDIGNRTATIAMAESSRVWFKNTVERVPDTDEGCTLTIGYWKTHSEYGPARYDETWALLADGADTPFFLSGLSYYDALHTQPRGNAYFQLAQQYIGATLNGLSGASLPGEVVDALDDATALLETYSPADVASWRGNRGERPAFIELAGILDDYNNGLIGPGHCG